MNEKSADDPILPPAKHPRRDIARGAAEAIASIIPGANVVTTLLRETHPSKTDKLRETWESEITEQSNSHEQRLDEHQQILSPVVETVDGAAASMLEALAKDCPDGMKSKWYDLDDFTRLLPDADSSDINQAVFDFEAIGMLEVHSHFQGWRVRVTSIFYQQIDTQVMGWNTRSDAATIAQLMLDRDELRHVPALFEHLGWPRRRLNPALDYLRQFVPEGRTSDPVQDQFELWGFGLAEEDQARFRRFIKSENAH
jgi:hypothetical protein